MLVIAGDSRVSTGAEGPPPPEPPPPVPPLEPVEPPCPVLPLELEVDPPPLHPIKSIAAQTIEQIITRCDPNVIDRLSIIETCRDGGGWMLSYKGEAVKS